MTIYNLLTIAQEKIEKMKGTPEYDDLTFIEVYMRTSATEFVVMFVDKLGNMRFKKMSAIGKGQVNADITDINQEQTATIGDATAALQMCQEIEFVTTYDF